CGNLQSLIRGKLGGGDRHISVIRRHRRSARCTDHCIVLNRHALSCCHRKRSRIAAHGIGSLVNDTSLHNSASHSYGTCRIKQELYRHGIHTDLWEEAMEELPPPPSQDEIIDKLLRSKLRSSEPDQKEIKKATDALLRRGFSWSEISASKQRVLNDCEDWTE
ncbi:MAG: RecX family transcriptional regulator, partial [Oscillospiraceae bacterium]|nr:RecX family transcriptional regulator [Oscillospiraceae bacterium]